MLTTPAPPRCERLLRVAVDAIDDPEMSQSELSNFALRARNNLFDAYADGAPGEVEFYLATHYDRFTPWWAEERAAVENARLEATRVAREEREAQRAAKVCGWEIW